MIAIAGIASALGFVRFFTASTALGTVCPPPPPPAPASAPTNAPASDLGHDLANDPDDAE